jgi:iron complex outermembrane receptor protein
LERAEWPVLPRCIFSTAACTSSLNAAHRREQTEDVTVNQTRRFATRFIAFAALSLPLLGDGLRAQENRDLSSLSVDDLMNVEVTSVSRKGQKVSDTAAAVFVITQDDIRRSGATTIPEILRIVPGLDVARVNGNVWAISARGSNGQYANKLLVMIDGRSVYTSLFSGVFWDAQDTLLEDIDRIEVIRGPGGTLWGANAVNGVINIITKHAIETQGTLLSTGGGAAEGSSAAGRFGGAMGRNGFYRAYGKTFDRPASVGGTDPSHDEWSMGRAGFRADWASHGGDTFTVQGDTFRGTEATLGVFGPASPLADRSGLNHVSGSDVSFSWAAIQSSRSDTALHVVYDATNRAQPGFADDRHSFDLDFQQHLKLGSRNDVVWGAGYRLSDSRTGGAMLQLVRDTNTERTASAFVQDEIQATQRLRLTLGTKIQHEPDLQLELQPTLRLLYKISDRRTIWAAATSAIRMPSDVEEDMRLTVGTFPDGTEKGGLLVLTGNPELKPERVESYELGYRWQASSTVAFDATAFHNQLRDLIVSAPAAPFVDSSRQTIIPIAFTNSGRSRAAGAEFLLTDAVAANWNVALGYSFYQTRSGTDRSAPRHQFQLRSSYQLPRQVELDASAFYVGRLGSGIAPFLRLDTQLTWHAGKRWELSIAGRNLIGGGHPEFLGTNGESALATPAQRTVNGKITCRF